MGVDYHVLLFRTLVLGFQVKRLFGSFHSFNTSVFIFVVAVFCIQFAVEFTSGYMFLIPLRI
ncbi:hypothetical protein Bca4012_018610 [Brassica carinata]